MCATFTDDDVGKTVVNASGEEVGIVSAVEHGSARVKPDPGITDTIKAKLGWEGTSEDTYPLQEDSVERVTDDEIRLKGDLTGAGTGTAGAGAGAGTGTGTGTDTGTRGDDEFVDTDVRDDDDELIDTDIGDDERRGRDDDDLIDSDVRDDDDQLIGDDDTSARDDDDELIDTDSDDDTSGIADTDIGSGSDRDTDRDRDRDTDT